MSYTGDVDQLEELQPLDEMSEVAAPQAAAAPAAMAVLPAPAYHPMADKEYYRFLFAGIVFFFLWIVSLIMYAGGRDREQVFNEVIAPGQTLIEEISFGEPGKAETLDIELAATGMSNSWAFAEIILVDPKTEEAIALGLEVDAYSGVDGGESWSEGTNPRSKTLGAIEGGTYTMQINTQAGTTGNPADGLRVTVKHDVPLGRYMFIPFLMIILFPAINLGRKLAFETKRWANSDHSISSGGDWSDFEIE